MSLNPPPHTRKSLRIRKGYTLWSRIGHCQCKSSIRLCHIFHHYQHEVEGVKPPKLSSSSPSAMNCVLRCAGAHSTSTWFRPLYAGCVGSREMLRVSSHCPTHIIWRDVGLRVRSMKSHQTVRYRLVVRQTTAFSSPVYSLYSTQA